MKKVMITGSNGFVGSHLIKKCIREECEILALIRPKSSFKNLISFTDGKEYFSDSEKENFKGELVKIQSNNRDITFIECDIKNAVLMDKIIQEFVPDIVFHLAAQPYIVPSWEDPRDTIETNVIGTINIFEPLKINRINAKVILACTAAEFGETTKLNRPLKEEDPLKATHPYGISKIAAELLSRQYFLNFGIETVNLRFFNLTGDNRENDAPSDFVRKVAEIELGLNKPEIEVGNLNPYRDFTDINEAVEIIWQAALKGVAGETYHLCSGRKTQIRELLNIALSFTKKEIKVVENVTNKLRKTDEDVLVGDNSKLQKELGVNVLKPIEITLREMYNYWIDYYTENNLQC
ncbi:MAG: GDP-mannose 4,6-dehydratase [Candidatus Lokiarchaeota archaeon]|nr:GDP-mannose 4,6-dehydratase [Candidatus Lokiarchaeota archaeon]